uniref:Uncharacterized protein n=1 Tax=Heterorhabditis bacteriophora TaxID=37862 RepID=A0A1I7X183_HETBA
MSTQQFSSKVAGLCLKRDGQQSLSLDRAFWSRGLCLSSLLSRGLCLSAQLPPLLRGRSGIILDAPGARIYAQFFFSASLISRQKNETSEKYGNLKEFIFLNFLVSSGFKSPSKATHNEWLDTTKTTFRKWKREKLTSKLTLFGVFQTHRPSAPKLT